MSTEAKHEKRTGNFQRAVAFAIAKSDETDLPFVVIANPIRQGYIACPEADLGCDSTGKRIHKPLFTIANKSAALANAQETK